MAADASTLSPLDAAFLYLETPTQPLHVGCVALLEAPVPFDDLLGLFEERLLRLRRYRQRPVRPVLDLGLPSWEDARDFDPRRHVRRVAVPPPGDDEALHELVDSLFATNLDPALPLWEAYLIEGLRGGKAALLFKIHHCMIDGVSGAQLLEALTDAVEPPPGTPAPTLPPPRGRQPGPLERLVGLLDPSGPRARLQAVREVLRTIGSFVATPPSRLPFNGALSGRRQIVWTSFPMEEVLAIRGAMRCKVNDVVLAVIAGALRHYLGARGVAPDAMTVRTLVPVSVRPPSDHLTLGNLVAAMFPQLPVALADPLARLRTIAREMSELKERGQARASVFFLNLVGQLPALVEALMGRLVAAEAVVNTVCTNVPGPPGRRTLLGRRVLEVHPLVPLFQGIGLEFAILSYGGRLSITAAADPSLVPDARRIADALTASFAELRAAALETSPPAEVVRAPSRVGDLMTRELLAVSPANTFADAWQVMREARIRHLPVVDGELRLVGLVTQRDLLGHAPSDLEQPREDERLMALARVHIGDLMETHLSTATPDEPLAVAGRRMLDAKIGCLPVVTGDGRLVGILTESDFVRCTTALAAEVMRPNAVRDAAATARS
ncbi:MAG TPA: wax ester/triacylglycerol synthase family O-acyltransferase [Candidatus Limnocylindria bacterium]|nr:wax ester/triacylglycerol synthase family O-acyltransferase [Candidatus Limnocylindria bacterium]